jgi:ABC-type dipeptide/oligopeptide/nickel transport system permease subunit
MMIWVDLLSRILHGTRTSLFIGVSTVTIALVIGIATGLSAGYFGGWIDMIIRATSTCNGRLNYHRGLSGCGVRHRPLNVIVAISLAFVDDFARVYSMTLTLRHEQYVDTARIDWDFRISHAFSFTSCPMLSR